ncbi:MAG: ribonuclease III [Porticoccaceae bacterium]|nr:ribonuclease III [Porticoccaceae bacterium]
MLNHSMDIARQRLINRLGHSFSDQRLLDLALTHRSCGSHNNERLEFLGDSILGAVVTEYLYRHFPQAQEGDLSRVRSSLVKGTSLARVAKGLELGEHLILGAGERKSGGHRRDSILADAVEAIIGAIYLDAGLEAARDCIQQWLQPRLQQLLDNGDLENSAKDAKTRLQEFLQARGKALPSYQVESVSGEAHNQQFTISCHVELLPGPVIAEGSNRRKAEQQAAEMALQQLQ